MERESEAVLLTVPEAAKLLRIGRDTVYKLVNEGRLPVVRLGKAVRIPRSALMSFIERTAESAVRA